MRGDILLALAALAFVATAVGAGILYYRHLTRVGVRLPKYPLQRRNLLTGNEVDFLRRLESAVGDKFRVLPQVSMGAVLSTDLHPDHPDYWAVRESFAAKIIDFVICDARTFAPLLVVELDDVMHDFARDRTRDALVARGGLNTVRFWSRKKPSVETIRAMLFAQLGKAVTSI